MAFMEHEVTDKKTWILIDGNDGTTFIPVDVAPDVRIAVNLGNDARAEELALQFYPGSHVYSVELTEGYGARLSAPGYLDCTEWNVFDTQQAAEEYLRDEYPEDSEDGDEDEV